MFDMKNLTRLKKLDENAPDTMKTFWSFDKEAFKAGALDSLHKQLMAVSVALTTQCPYCIELHVRAARQAGANDPMPIVGETNDGYLNDIRGRHITPEDVANAIRNAESGAVDEGTVGAGTGTVAFGWKGGIGTASRRLPAAFGGYMLGVLVQSNFGGILTINGAPVGQELGQYYLRKETGQQGAKDKADGFLHDGHRHGRSAGRTQSQAACSESMGWDGPDR